jgi:glycosyltransferase involved in cell wall biosynthesis
MGVPRLAVVRDFRAEGWPSMDLCADQLLAHLPDLAPADLAPPFRRRVQRILILGRRHAAFNADRLLNRHVYLPRALRRAASRFDLFHIADHTYAHAVLALPPGRAGVYCHDLDAFRCLLDPAAEPRPWWFRRLARRTLRGLRAAAVVFHNSATVGRQLVAAGLVPPDRLVHAPLGVAAEFIAADGPVAAEPYLLHVGNNIPRKRLDVLLDVFAVLREKFPGLRLVQVGGPWPTALAHRIDRLGIGPWVTQVRGLTRSKLAGLYQQAAAVLVPSETEGFGLPVIEALACGAPVVASDLPVLREAGGPAVVFAPVGDVAAWAATVARILADPAAAPARDARLVQAARYSWAEHARVIGHAYRNLWARA